MADRGLPIGEVVQVSATIAAGGVARREYGAGLLVTTEDGIPAGGSAKIKRYADIDAVKVDWPSGHAYDAASVWFGADAEPHALFIGRWATADVATTVTGTEPASPTTGALDAANATFSVNGQDVSATNLSSADTYAAIASTIQTKIVALMGIFSNATFVHDATANDGAGGFVLTLDDAEAVANGGAFAAISDGSGTDISAALGFASPDYAQGHDTETLSEAVAEMLPVSAATVSGDGNQAAGGSPVLLMVDGSCPNAVGTIDTRESLAAIIQAGDYFGFIRDNGTDALAASGTFRHHVFDEQSSKVAAVVGAGENFGAGTNYVDVAANAFLSSQQFDLPASIKNPHLKAMSGATALRVTGAQLANLEATRTSAYTIIAGVPSLIGGYAGKTGIWADSQYFLGWLKNDFELSIFNAQRGSDRFATAILTDTINAVMARAVRTGGIGVGARVNNSVRNQIRNTLNAPDFDGILPNGWVAWIEQPASRSDADREARIGRFRVWLASSDAVNEVVANVTLSS